jgi:hypothetical protein
MFLTTHRGTRKHGPGTLAYPGPDKADRGVGLGEESHHDVRVTSQFVKRSYSRRQTENPEFFALLYGRSKSN